ncbi:MAG: trigger factor [Calditrichaeota bacterium]|nr:MAG: trigger factor [Calditrichota bacterium]
MKFEVKKTSSTKRQFTVKVDSEELHPIAAKVLKAFQKRATIPGFRPGRAPMNLVKKRYQDDINSQVIDDAIKKYYVEALDQSDVEPIAPGVITDIKFDDVANGLEFEFEVEVEPDIELKKYKGIKVEKTVFQVTDEMVDDALRNLQERFATEKEAEIVEEGYLVTLTLQQLGEGDLPIVGRKYEDIRVKVGSGEFDKEIEDQLIGLKVGEETVVRRVIPTPPEAQQEQPTMESYRVTVEDIKMQELPPLDEEFIKNLDDDSVSTIEELREKIRKHMEADFEKRSQEILRSRIMEELLKENPFDVPQSMVDHYMHHLIEDLKKSSQERIDEEFIRQQYMADVINDIRAYLLKQKIIETEKLDVTDEEVKEYIDALDIPEEEKEKGKNQPDVINSLRRQLLDQKFYDFIISNAEITEVFPPSPQASASDAESEQDDETVEEEKESNQ